MVVLLLFMSYAIALSAALGRAGYRSLAAHSNRATHERPKRVVIVGATGGTGRQLVAGKQGAIPGDLEPILLRLGVDPANWLQLAGRFGRLFQVVAGSPEALDHEQARCKARGRPRRRGYHAPGRHLLGRPTAG